MADDYFFGCNLLCEARFTRQLVVLVKELLEGEAGHAVDQRGVGLDIETQVEEGLLSPRRRLAQHACHNVN